MRDLAGAGGGARDVCVPGEDGAERRIQFGLLRAASVDVPCPRFHLLSWPYEWPGFR
jgi:hypothetical protein